MSLAAMGLYVACSSSDGGSGPSATYTIEVNPQTLALTLGGASATGTVTATLTQKLGANSVIDQTSPVSWTTSDATVATVSTSGRTVTVTGVGHGTATITATAQGISATTSVSVTAPACLISSSNPAVTAGTPLSGSLSNSDCRYNNAPSDFYRLVVPSTQSITIDLSTTAFIPQITLFSASGGTVLANHYPTSGGAAQVRFGLAAGTYTIAVGANSATASGNYTLSVTTAAASFCLLANATNVAVPQTVNGTLASSDCLLTGSDPRPADLYKFTLGSTQVVTLTTASAAFASITNLYDVNGNFIVADSSSASQSRVTRTLGAGTYYVASEGKTFTSSGAYTLTLAGTASTACSAASSIQTITPTTGGTTVNGTLAAGDCTIFDGTFADVYKITVSANATVQVDMTSSAFDAFLWLFDSNFVSVTSDDNGGGGTNARISRSLTAGTYYIEANSFAFGQSGAYTLTVKIP
jgi:hypothetical protein